MIQITFLGTSAAAPTLSRNVTAIAVRREGELILFDCAEGTQRQMMRFRTGFDVGDIFFTHFHADHFLGIIGFVRTLWMGGRREPVRLYGPRPAKRLLTEALSLGVSEAHLPIEVFELGDGDRIRRQGYEVRAFKVDHRIPALGYTLVEDDRPGPFDLEKAQALGIPEGPLFGKLQRGQAITLPDGRTIASSEVVGQPRRGHKIVISGDTRPCEATRLAAEEADLLIHESTFGDDEQERARETAHSTARQAARLAAEARVKRLVLTHFSSRHDLDVGPLLKQARDEFPRVQCARDGLQIDLPQRPEQIDPTEPPPSPEARISAARALTADTARVLWHLADSRPPRLEGTRWSGRDERWWPWQRIELAFGDEGTASPTPDAETCAIIPSTAHRNELLLMRSDGPIRIRFVGHHLLIGSPNGGFAGRWFALARGEP